MTESSKDLQIIQHALATWDARRPVMGLPATRGELAKRRWRGVAADGREFGFDLDAPLADGAVFFESETALYALTQLAEPVLEIDFRGPAEAAQLGWMLGNLHMGVEVTRDGLRVVDDAAVRQMLAREGLAFRPAERVFHPLRGNSPGPEHGHQH